MTLQIKGRVKSAIKPSTRKTVQKIFFSKEVPRVDFTADCAAPAYGGKNATVHVRMRKVQADQLIAGVGAYAYNKHARENHA
jgi:hypothetical protein